MFIVTCYAVEDLDCLMDKDYAQLFYYGFCQACFYVTLFLYVSLLEKNPDFKVTKSCPTKHIYWSLYNESKFNVKCEAVFPQIKFPTVFRNIFSEAIDPLHRDICYLLPHDIVYTNYYLYIHRFACNAKLKSCYYCGQI